MYKFKSTLFILFFISNLVFSQVTEQDYIDLIKNGIILSSYLELNKADEISSYLEKIGYRYYEVENTENIAFVRMQAPISQMILIKTKDKKVIFSIDLPASEEFDFDIFYNNFESVMEKGLPYHLFSQMKEIATKEIPTVIHHSPTLLSYENKNGEREYYSASNFFNDFLKKENYITIFNGPYDGRVIIDCSNKKGVTFFSGNIHDIPIWFDEFINKGLNEVIWRKKYNESLKN